MQEPRLIRRSSNLDLPPATLDGLVLPDHHPDQAAGVLDLPPYQVPDQAETHFKLKPRKYKELVVGIQGPRGAGKDAFGCYWAFTYLFADVPVYSNTPIAGEWDLGYFKSENLFASQLFAMGQGYVDEQGQDVAGFKEDCLIYYSEIDKLIHRRRSTSNANMILRVLATQLRKSGISVAATAQDWFWLDSDWIYQTDVLVNCMDLAMSGFGHEEKMEEGFVTYLEFFDISGVITGYKYRDTGRPFDAQYFNTRMMWDPSLNGGQGPMYDSYAFYGLDEILTKVVLDKKERHIGGGTGNKAVPTFENMDLRGYLPRSQALETITNAVSRLKDQGVKAVPAETLRRILEDGGYKADVRDMGQKMKALGIHKEKTSKGIVYGLEGFVGKAEDEL